MAYQFSFNPCIFLYFDKFICIKWHYIESSFQHNKQFIASESEDLQHDLVLFLYFDSNLLTKNNLVPNNQSELCLKRSCSSAIRQVVNVYLNQLYLCTESEYKLNQLQGNHITKILSKIFSHKSLSLYTSLVRCFSRLTDRVWVLFVFYIAGFLPGFKCDVALCFFQSEQNGKRSQVLCLGC